MYSANSSQNPHLFLKPAPVILALAEHTLIFKKIFIIFLKMRVFIPISTTQLGPPICRDDLDM